MRIATISYVFMGVSIAVQGVLQGLGYSIMPLVLSSMRLVVFLLPVAYIFARSSDPTFVWWSFIVAEVATSVFAFIFIAVAMKKVKGIDEQSLQKSSGAKSV